jgi:lysine biosynthesis protein LysW
MTMVITTCPVCKQEVIVSEHPDIGTQVICEACGMKLEVVWLYPLAVDCLIEKGTTECEPTNLSHHREY